MINICGCDINKLNNVLKLLLGVLVLMFIIVYISKFVLKKMRKESKWLCLSDYNMSGIMNDVLLDHDMVNTKIVSDDIIMVVPSGYDFIDHEIRIMENIDRVTKKPNVFFILKGTDVLTSKDRLWSVINNTYGEHIASMFTPKTYIVSNESDITKFKDDNNISRDNIVYKMDGFDGKLYILKKNIQRQEGLKIMGTRDVANMITYDRKLLSDYVVIQELLQDPYMINDRKINMRYYLLVVIKNVDVNKKVFKVYMYDDGFMYYTRNKFVKNSKNHDDNVTTGYIDRKVYDENPLTHGEFYEYLNDDKRVKTVGEEFVMQHYLKYHKNLGDYLRGNVMELFKHVLEPYRNILDSATDRVGGISFQLYGADIAVGETLVPSLMEINKGPDMNAKDEKDRKLKYKCSMDVLKKVGIMRDECDNNGFVKLIDTVIVL